MHGRADIPIPLLSRQFAFSAISLRAHFEFFAFFAFLAFWTFLAFWAVRAFWYSNLRAMKSDPVYALSKGQLLKHFAAPLAGQVESLIVPTFGPKFFGF